MISVDIVDCDGNLRKNSHIICPGRVCCTVDVISPVFRRLELICHACKLFAGPSKMWRNVT